MLFQFFGLNHAEDDAKLNFLPNSKSLLSGFSIEVSFVSEFISEGEKKKQKVSVKTLGC